MFERFTEGTRQVIVLAQDEARILKHKYIGTEHILLGLLREEEGLAARVLRSLDIRVERVRAQVVRIVGAGEEFTSGQIPFTPRAKKVLELALRESLSLGHNYIGTEHILLGLARENEGVAARVLLDFETDSEKIRNEVIRMISGPGGRQRSSGQGAHPSESKPKTSPPEGVLDNAGWVIETLCPEIQNQLGRSADAGDLLITLASLGDGFTSRTLARLGVEPEALKRAVEETRSEDVPPAFPGSSELLAEIERVRREKETHIEAEEWEQAANCRDVERRLVTETRDHEQRGRQAALTLARKRLGLAKEA